MRFCVIRQARDEDPSLEGLGVSSNSTSQNLPAVNSISVRSCHLFMATNHVSPLRRQLRSMTSFEVSLFKALSTDCRRSRENLPEGKRKDVMMTL